MPDKRMVPRLQEHNPPTTAPHLILVRKVSLVISRTRVVKAVSEKSV